MVLMLKWYQQPTSVDTLTEVLNYIFTAIFFLEAVIKLLGVGLRLYFSDGWNNFDFIIVLGSIASIFISK